MEEERGTNSFDCLSYNEGLLIASSSEVIGRLLEDKRDEYRKIVEKLMKNTGILNADRTDDIQKHHLRKKVIGDFRRNTTPRPPMEDNNGGYNEDK